MGIGVVLDGFGTGSMPLVGLAQFPVDALKVDRSLIREMQSDRVTADVVELIITLAHKMNLKVIAEGIETARQLGRPTRTRMRVWAGIFLLAAAGASGRVVVHAAAGGRAAVERRRSRVGYQKSFEPRVRQVRRLSRQPPRTAALPSAVSWRNDPAIFRGSAQAIEHAPGFERDFGNGIFAIAFVA
jgi:EAL domain